MFEPADELSGEREERIVKRKGILRVTAVFFALMICFTILSRAAYQEGTAVVSTSRPSNMVISHQIRTTGKVVQNQEMAVTTVPNLRVASIEVSQGERVAKGDLLFTLDMDMLKERILDQQQEMEKQQLNVEDAKSQKDVSSLQKANEQAQAAENYSLNTNRAGVALSRAKRNLDEAKKELKEFRKNSGQSQEDGSVENALEEAVEEKTQAYIAAQEELDQLEWQIENAVYTALQTAGAGTASLEKTGTSKTSAPQSGPEAGTAGASLESRQSAMTRSGDELLLDEGDLAGDGGAEAGNSQAGGAVFIAENGSSGGSAPAGGNLENSGIVNNQESGAFGGELAGDGILEDEGQGGTGTLTPGGPDPSDGILDTSGDSWGTSDGLLDTSEGSPDSSDGILDTSEGSPDTSDGVSGGILGGESGEEQEEFEDILLEEDPADPAEDGADSVENPEDILQDGDALLNGEIDGGSNGDAALTQDELDALEQSVRDRYQSQLVTAKKKVETALGEKQSAEAALMAYQQERMAASSASAAQTEQALLDNVQAAQDAYVDASIAANEAAVTSGRAVASAGIPNASNSSDRINEITYEQMELQLEKLEKLQEEGGRVCAPSDGLVTGISVQTGGMTTDTTAILLADLSKGCSFVGEITEDQEQYIGTGDLVTLTGSSKNKKFEELPVAAVTADEENEGIFRITVQIPEDTLELGAAATLEFTKKSEAYPICVPISALYLDEKNMPYVLVTDEVDSIMGTELTARKVSVTVLEQNESYAALAEGAVSSQQEVIVNSDKSVDDGSRVRLAG